MRLSAEDTARLDSSMIDIAEEARGAARADASGGWRIGDNRSLVIHPGGHFFDFSDGTGGYGGLSLLQHIYRIDELGAVEFAREWLDSHPGNGRLAHGVDANEDAVKAEDDAFRTGMIVELWSRSSPIPGTLGEKYFATRGLAPCADDLLELRWLEHARGDEGAMVAAIRDDVGRLVAIQLTHVCAEGRKSHVEPVRQTFRGPHDWNRRGFARFGDAGDELVICEGVEDALSARAGGAKRVVALTGLSRLGKANLPPGVNKVVVVRDDDPAGSNADLSLWRGVTRLLGQGVNVLVSRRASAVAGPDAPALKDINDLLQRDPERVPELLRSASATPPDMTQDARNAILDEASCLGPDAYELARKRIAELLGWSRVKALDEACHRRKTERMEARSQRADRVNTEPWPDPVTDFGLVLDDTVAELKRYIRAPDSHFHTAVLWCAHAHLVHQEELGVDISPRLALQSPAKRCGKTTFLKGIGCLVPRPKIASSLTVSALFRAVDARKVSLLIDEADNIVHANANPELLAVINAGYDLATAVVLRSVPLKGGEFEDREFRTFTAVALTSIKRFPDTVQDRCIALPLKRATKEERPEHLAKGRSQALLDAGRRMARWAADLRELPDTQMPASLHNRIGDNWHILLQVAEVAGGEWPARALSAAAANLAAEEREGDRETGITLLRAIWRVFRAERIRRLHTAELVTNLLALEEERWGEVNRGKPISSCYLRDNLADFLPEEPEKVAPRRWKNGTGSSRRGYHELHLQDAFLRYLGLGLPSEEGIEDEEEDHVSRGNAHDPSERPSDPTHPTRAPKNDVYSVGYNASDISSASDAAPDPDPTHGNGSPGDADTRRMRSDAASDAGYTSGAQNGVQFQEFASDVSDALDQTAPGEGPRAHYAQSDPDGAPHASVEPVSSSAKAPLPRGAIGRKHAHRATGLGRKS